MVQVVTVRKGDLSTRRKLRKGMQQRPINERNNIDLEAMGLQLPEPDESEQPADPVSTDTSPQHTSSRDWHQAARNEMAL